MMVEMALQRLSICSCGDTVLKDGIKVGAKYMVDTVVVHEGCVYHCGKCGKEMEIAVVLASQILNPFLPPRPLPYRLFAVLN